MFWLILGVILALNKPVFLFCFYFSGLIRELGLCTSLLLVISLTWGVFGGYLLMGCFMCSHAITSVFFFDVLLLCVCHVFMKFGLGKAKKVKHNFV